jgi:hypothetical protein
MYERPVILKKHGVTEAQVKTLETHSYFQKLLDQTAREWNSPRSINERLALESAVALEGAIPDIAARMGVKNEPLTGVVEAGKLLAKIAGAGEQRQQQAPGEKFTITINLGGETQVYEKTRPALDLTAEIQSVSERSSLLPTIQPFPAGPSPEPTIQPFPAGTNSLLDLQTEPDGD